MESTASIKSEIISQLNHLSEDGLKEVKWFVKFLSAKNLSKKYPDSKSSQNNHSEDDLFEICGMWENREIDVNTLRKKAWRETQW